MSSSVTQVADRISAEPLAKELQKRGHSVWFDEWEIGIGDSIIREDERGRIGGFWRSTGPSCQGILRAHRVHGGRARSLKPSMMFSPLSLAPSAARPSVWSSAQLTPS